MVKGTIMSFVVAVVFILVYMITWMPVFAILAVFMALFGGVLVLLGLKDKVDTEIEENDDEELM